MHVGSGLHAASKGACTKLKGMSSACKLKNTSCIRTSRSEHVVWWTRGSIVLRRSCCPALLRPHHRVARSLEHQGCPLTRPGQTLGAQSVPTVPTSTGKLMLTLPDLTSATTSGLQATATISTSYGTVAAAGGVWWRVNWTTRAGLGNTERALDPASHTLVPSVGHA